MSVPLRLPGGVVIAEEELSWRFSRSGGPGGQHANTSDTRVSVSFDVRRSAALPPVLRDRALSRLEGRLTDGILTLTAADHRSQHLNRRLALERLGQVLRQATAPPPRRRRPTRPSRAAAERRLDAKRRRAQTKRMRRDPGGDA